MKLGICFCIFLSGMICVSAIGMWSGGCKNDQDCEDNQCCAAQFGSYMGQCLRRPQEGENCIPKNKYSGMFQSFACPCTDGLECSTKSKNKASTVNNSSPPKCQKIILDEAEIESSAE